MHSEVSYSLPNTEATEPLSISQIAEEEDISKNILKISLNSLKKGGIVQKSAGAGRRLYFDAETGGNQSSGNHQRG